MAEPEMYTVTASGIYLKVLLYGDPGSGKTTLGASAQDHEVMGDVLMCNVEGGTLSIAHRGDIKTVDIHNTQEVENVFWAITKSKSNGTGKYAKINTVMLDNATELQQMNLQEIVQAEIEKPGSKRFEKWDLLDEIWREDYGKSTNQLKRLFRWFRQLPVNFIVTAHVKKVFPKGPNNQPNPNADPVAIIPSLTDQLSRAVMGYVDFVWYMYYDDGTREDEDDVEPTFNILTRPHGIHFAKTRGPRFAEAIGKVRQIPPDRAMAEIYDLYLHSTGQKAGRTITTTTKKVKRA